MENKRNPKTKFWLIPEFHDLELLRVQKIHYQYARHSHPTYSIGIIEEGVGGNFYRGSTYLAPPKSVVLMNPEEVHTGYSAEELPLTYRMLYPSSDFLKNILDNLSCQKGIPYFPDAVIQNQKLANQVLVLHKMLEFSQDFLTKESILIEVLSVLLGHYAEIKLQLPRLGKETQAVCLIKEYLQANFSSQISLDQLVKITNLNRFYLIRVFRQAVGMPPYTYLNQIRIRKAKALLVQGYAIAEVANAVGMSDQSHLNRHFKKIVGVTPGQYCSR